MEINEIFINALLSDATYVNGLTGDTTADFIDGGDGNDDIVAGFGADLILGGLGNDTIAGAGGGDVLMGGEGDDTLVSDGLLHPGLLGSADPAAHGADFVDGGDGNDSIDGGGAADMLMRGAGNDLIRGDTRPEDWNQDGSHYELPNDTITDDDSNGVGDDDALIDKGSSDADASLVKRVRNAYEMARFMPVDQRSGQ